MKNSKQESRSSAPNGRLCFHCKQPGHLKKDCPEQLYCSRCGTQGHIPARCSAKQQGNKPNQEGCEFLENSQSHETHKEEWKKSQDQPQFSHQNNKCLHQPVITNLMIAPLGNNTRLTPLAILPVAQVFIKTTVNFQTLHIFHSKANPLLASPHLHSQSLTHHFSIIFSICHQLTNN